MRLVGACGGARVGIPAARVRFGKVSAKAEASDLRCIFRIPSQSVQPLRADPEAAEGRSHETHRTSLGHCRGRLRSHGLRPPIDTGARNAAGPQARQRCAHRRGPTGDDTRAGARRSQGGQPAVRGRQSDSTRFHRAGRGDGSGRPVPESHDPQLRRFTRPGGDRIRPGYRRRFRRTCGRQRRGREHGGELRVCHQGRWLEGDRDSRTLVVRRDQGRDRRGGARQPDRAAR